MKRIWLVRHAQSKAQTEEEFSLDSSLSAEGKKQAAKLKDLFAGMTFDRAYISPLKRARETFELAGADCKKIIFDSRLVEIVPDGEYGGLLPYPSSFGYGEPDKRDAWRQPPVKRLAAFLDDIASAKFERAVVFSHAMALSALLNIFLRGKEAADFDGVNAWRYCIMSNTAVSMISIDSDICCNRLLYWNYSSHIENWNPMSL